MLGFGYGTIACLTNRTLNTDESSGAALSDTLMTVGQ